MIDVTRKLSMQFFSRFFVSLTGVFFRVEPSKVVNLAVRHNRANPFLVFLSKVNAFITGYSFFEFPIEIIFGISRLSQIAPSIITWISVYVIDSICRPRTGLVCPYKSVNKNEFATKADDISFFERRPWSGSRQLKMTSAISRLSSGGSVFFPPKITGVRIVGKIFLKQLRIYVGFLHESYITPNAWGYQQ